MTSRARRRSSSIRWLASCAWRLRARGRLSIYLSIYLEHIMATIHRIQPLVLAAGYGTRLQQSIVDAAALHSPLPQHRHRRQRHADAPTSLFDHIRSLPKVPGCTCESESCVVSRVESIFAWQALVPIGGRSDGRSVLLDVWLHEFQRATAAAAAAARARCHEQDAMQIEVLPVAIVVNHTMAPHFRRWASERRLNAQWLQSADLDAAAADDDGDGATPSASPSDVQVLLIDDRSLSNDDRLGAIGDLALSMQLLAYVARFSALRAGALAHVTASFVAQRALWNSMAARRWSSSLCRGRWRHAL